jgi:hypothetical protein
MTLLFFSSVPFSLQDRGSWQAAKKQFAEIAVHASEAIVCRAGSALPADPLAAYPP